MKIKIRKDYIRTRAHELSVGDLFEYKDNVHIMSVFSNKEFKPNSDKIFATRLDDGGIEIIDQMSIVHLLDSRLTVSYIRGTDDEDSEYE